MPTYGGFAAYAAAYAPEVGIGEAQYGVLVVDAAAWADEVMAGVANPDSAQVERAVYAYLLHLYQASPAAAALAQAESIRLGPLSVKFDADAFADFLAFDWLGKAHGHLISAGLPYLTPVAAALA